MDHHALLLIDDEGSALDQIENWIKDNERYDYLEPTLAISQVREIIRRAHQRPFATAYQFLVIKARTIPVEAQNALLKVIEEPPAATRFIFIVERSTYLLPTILSRVSLLRTARIGSARPRVFEDFLRADPAARIALIAAMAKNKDEASYQELYDGLIAWQEEQEIADDIELARSVQRSLVWLAARGSSKKMIWEDLALTLPVEA